MARPRPPVSPCVPWPCRGTSTPMEFVLAATTRLVALRSTTSTASSTIPTGSTTCSSPPPWAVTNYEPRNPIESGCLRNTNWDIVVVTGVLPSPGSADTNASLSALTNAIVHNSPDGSYSPPQAGGALAVQHCPCTTCATAIQRALWYGRLLEFSYRQSCQIFYTKLQTCYVGLVRLLWCGGRDASHTIDSA